MDESKQVVDIVTFEDIFYYVMNRIIKHENSNEIMKILEEEMLDTIGQCFTGRMTRLVNVLNGYYDDIEIKIGTNEQISNIIVIYIWYVKSEVSCIIINMRCCWNISSFCRNKS